MDRPKLTYFDAPVSRGEECRLALHLGGIDFEDVRIKQADWPALRPKTPFGGLPVLEWPGHPALAQSNAILAFVGRRCGLHPKDDFEAARHEAVMCHVEDLRQTLGPSLRMDEAEKKRTREALAASYLPAWAGFVEKQIGDGPFFAGSRLHIVDLKLYSIVRWVASGRLDHIPSTLFASHKKLVALHDAVRDHEGVRAWYAKH
jgi:glutathione S-transferase